MNDNEGSDAATQDLVQDPTARLRVDSRVAVVTGASSGLGEHFARTLHAAGATVVLSARRRERLDAIADDLPGAAVIAADLSIATDRERLISEAIDTFGRIDILVNNAGFSHPAAIENESLDVFRQSLEINVTASWHLSKLAGTTMVANGSGSIVNVASVLGLVGSTPIKQANYTASKGAIVNLTRELALQWARKGIRVNALCPGWFPTEMTAGMEHDDASQAFIQANSPIDRMGRLHELDGPLLLLASEAGSFITGTTLIVDGGWLAR